MARQFDAALLVSLSSDIPSHGYIYIITFLQVAMKLYLGR